MKATQLSLFDETVRHELEQAPHEIAWLREQLDHQAQAPCPRCQDWARANAELDRMLWEVKAERDAARRMAEIWRYIDHVAEQERQSGRPGASRDDLTQLLKLAHPDRWNQGQPATELAHELSVAVNQLRTRAQA